MAIRTYKGRLPELGTDVYVDETALVVGEVVIGSNSSIWPMCVLRGDVNGIRIGQESNIQDGCVLHVTHRSEGNEQGHPLVVGDRVTVGHKVILHGCRIGNDSTVMDGAVLEDGVLLGAGSLVPPGKTLESGYLYLGNPARRVRPLNEREQAYFGYSAAHYVRLKDDYLKQA